MSLFEIMMALWRGAVSNLLYINAGPSVMLPGGFVVDVPVGKRVGDDVVAGLAMRFDCPGRVGAGLEQHTAVANLAFDWNQHRELRRPRLRCRSMVQIFVKIAFQGPIVEKDFPASGYNTGRFCAKFFRGRPNITCRARILKDKPRRNKHFLSDSGSGGGLQRGQGFKSYPPVAGVRRAVVVLARPDRERDAGGEGRATARERIALVEVLAECAHLAEGRD